MKKILFICGSAEPGKDGVGDYTMRLAAALVGKGYQVTIIALADKFVNELVTEVQHVEDSAVSIIRIPKKIGTSTKKNSIKSFVKENKPDWISLQYVPQAFEKRGLVFTLISILKSIPIGPSWHFMIHEIAVPKRGVIQRLVRIIQQSLLQQLYRQLKPKLVHTSITRYQKALQNLGISSSILPLFSNIPCINSTKIWANKQVFTIGFFSQLNVSSYILASLKALAIQATTEGLKLNIVLIGGKKERNAEFINFIREHKQINATCQATGYLSPTELSEQLTNCQLGICPTKFSLLGKSGSFAAFVEHGVPVLAPNNTNLKVSNSDFSNYKVFTHTNQLPPLETFEANKPIPLLDIVVKTFLTNMQTNNAEYNAI